MSNAQVQATNPLQAQLDAANTKIATLEQQLATAQARIVTDEHPVHSLLGKIAAEIERPEAILKKKVHALLDDVRSLF